MSRRSVTESSKSKASRFSMTCCFLAVTSQVDELPEALFLKKITRKFFCEWTALQWKSIKKLLQYTAHYIYYQPKHCTIFHGKSQFFFQNGFEHQLWSFPQDFLGPIEWSNRRCHNFRRSSQHERSQPSPAAGPNEVTLVHLSALGAWQWSSPREDVFGKRISR